MNLVTVDFSLNSPGICIWQSDTDEKGAIITFSDNYFDGTNYNQTTRAAIKGGTDTTGNTADGFLAFYTDSAGGNSADERMRIDKTGRVGIGNTSPAAKLHTVGTGIVNIVESSDTVSYTQYYNSSTSNGGTADGLTVGLNGTSAYIYLREAANLIFGTSDAERMRIASGGNVLIGTTSDAGYKLRVNGNSYQDGAATFASTVYVGGTLTAAGNTNITGDLTVGGTVTAQEFRTEYITQTIIYESGSTAFGNTYDDTHIYTGSLSIYGSGSTVLDVQGSQGQLFSVTDSLEGTLMSVNDISGLPILEVTSDDKVVMGTYNQNTLVVDGDKVGVGTAAPTQKLDVNGVIAIKGYNFADNDATYTKLYKAQSNSIGMYLGGAGDPSNYYDNDYHYFRNSGGTVNRGVWNGTGLGVGITSPTDRLHVDGNIKTHGFLNIDTSTTTPLIIQGTELISRPGSSTKIVMLNASNSYWQEFGVYTNGAERFTINASGNVGIGTTSPAATLDLYQSANTAAIRMASAGVGSKIYRLTSQLIGVSNAGFGIINDTDSRYELVINTDGNVGIGTTSPNSALHVGSTGANAYSSTITSGSNMKGIITALSNNADDMVGIYFATGTNTQGTHWSGITGARSQSATDWSTQLNFYTHDENLSNINNATQKMVIKGNGNVGIGTTSPSAKLHVYGSGQTEVRIASSTANTNSLLSFYELGIASWGIDAGQANGSFFIKDLYNSTTRLTINASGNVGIGTTSPGYRLVVQKTSIAAPAIMIGGAYFGGPRLQTYGLDADPNAWMGLGTDMGVGNYEHSIYYSAYSGLGKLTFGTYDGTAYTTRMLLNASGQLGIGTTSPASGYSLDVNGQGKFNRSVRVDGVETGNPVPSATDEAHFSGYGIIGNRGTFYVTNPGGTVQIGAGGGSAHASNPNAEFTVDKTIFYKNVGIGNTSPSVKLDIGTSSSTTSVGYVRLRGYDNYEGNIYKTATYGIYMDTNTNLRPIRIDGSAFITGITGNVGIGTSSPSSKLHIVGTTTSDGNIVPSDPGTHDLGQPDVRWRTVFCDILDSAGVHEANLATGNVEELATGTVLVWKNGKNVPCTVEGDHMRMGVAVNGIASPLVQGAEPVLVTGTVNEGDYLITSEVIGHAKAISRAEMLERNLYDCVLGKALESGSGSSYLLKTWITI